MNKPYLSKVSLTLVILLLSSCMQSIKYTTIISMPSCASIYAGETRDNLVKIEGETPIQYKARGFWKSWCYQVKKDNYIDSDIKCLPEKHGSRYIHFILEDNSAK